MKTSKKKPSTILIVLVCIWSIYFVFNTDRFIHQNIKAIDQTEMITIIGENSQKSYEFNEKMIDLVSYGGVIIEYDNLIEEFFKPYHNELDEINLSIVYKKDHSVLGIAKVYYSNENVDCDDCIIGNFMDCIYWCRLTIWKYCSFWRIIDWNRLWFLS